MGFRFSLLSRFSPHSCRRMLADLCRSGSSSRDMAEAKLRLCKDVVAAARATAVETACDTLTVPALAVHAAWACASMGDAGAAAEFVQVAEGAVQATLDAGKGKGRSVHQHDDAVIHGAALTLHGCAALAVPPTSREGGDASDASDADAVGLIKQGLSHQSITVSRFLPSVRMHFL